MAAVWIILLAAGLALALYFGRPNPGKRATVLAKPAAVYSQTSGDYQLPTGYDQDRLVLMVKDPYWLYAYWELAASTREEIAQNNNSVATSGFQPVLRVYDLTGHHLEAIDKQEVPFFDIEVNEFANNWWIYAGLPRHTFCLDLGHRLPDGNFVALMRSNLATTPSDSVALEIDPQWPPLEAAWEVLGAAYGAKAGAQAPSSPALVGPSSSSPLARRTNQFE